jgi:hypothetical protein
VSSYTDSELDLIRRAVAKYRAARGKLGIPTTCMDINRWHDPNGIGSTVEPLNQKTLQRFTSGKRIQPESARLIADFMDAMEPLEDIERVGDAAAQLFSTMFASVTGDGPLGDKLARDFVANYDVFLEGRALTRNPDPQARNHWIPKYPDREYAWDRPFEIPYSRISLIHEPYANWLRVVEHVFNTAMDAADEEWIGGEVYKGVLTASGLDSQYVIVLKDKSLENARTYIIEPDQNTWGQPLDKQRLVGGGVGYVGEKYVSTIGARQIMFVPTEGEAPLSD